MPIELRILGTLEVVVEGRPLALGGRKQRALLALLSLHANELISRDRLLEEVWPDSDPGAATASLHVYISQLRKALGDSATAIQTRSGGYVLTLARDQLDASRFERLLREGRQALAADDPKQARATLTEALSSGAAPRSQTSPTRASPSVKVRGWRSSGSRQSRESSRQSFNSDATPSSSRNSRSLSRQSRYASGCARS